MFFCCVFAYCDNVCKNLFMYYVTFGFYVVGISMRMKGLGTTLPMAPTMLGPHSIVTSIPLVSVPNSHLGASSLVFSCAYTLVFSCAYPLVRTTLVCAPNTRVAPDTLARFASL